MARHAVLNNVEHGNLKVKPLDSENKQAKQMCVSLSISEFRSANRNLPIVYHYDNENGQFYPMALMGLERDENLFLSQSGWSWGYIPAMIEKGPFQIGKQYSGTGDEKLIISIDLDDPSVNTESGNPIFLSQGGNSNYLLHIVTLLQSLSAGHEETARYCNRLADLELFEPFSMELELNQDYGLRLSGFYIINEEKLAQLEADILSELSRTGFLQAAYTSISSLSNLVSLVELKKRNR